MAPLLWSALVEFFFPPRCPGCDGLGPSDLLCRGCRLGLPRLSEPLRVEGCDDVLVSCRFADLARELVHRLKYRRDPHPARAMGAILGEVVAAAGVGRFVDGVVPIPLSRHRQLNRGYNQAALLALGPALALGCPVEPGLLRRPGHRPPQAGLDREARHRNIAGVFQAADEARGRALLLVDDVITTGVTMGEAARALKAAGARRIVAAAFAGVSLDARGDVSG